MLTLDELLALLPDNSSGEISAQDLRDTVTALWHKSSLGGHVDHLGNLVQGPPGWSAVRQEAGLYTVTHNLGTVIYTAVLTCLTHTQGVGYAPSIMSTTETEFTYQVYSSNHDGLHDVDTTFVVVID